MSTPFTIEEALETIALSDGRVTILWDEVRCEWSLPDGKTMNAREVLEPTEEFRSGVARALTKIVEVVVSSNHQWALTQENMIEAVYRRFGKPTTEDGRTRRSPAT